VDELSEFAADLSHVVAAILPDRFEVSARGATIALRSGSDGVNTDLPGFFTEGDGRADQIVSASMSILNTIQDFVSEGLTVPWPQDVDSVALRMAMPGASLAGERLTLWFGRPDKPSVAIGELNIGSLLRAKLLR
jgi:hypothetical protein